MHSSVSPNTLLRDFVNSLGFDSNPFEYTNADQEDRLKDYFVPPPYFASVFGDPKNPTSFIVYAPRGGGKSAQRIMIENQCAENDVLAIRYDQFEFPELPNAKDIQLHHHLRNIIKFTLLALLIDLHQNPVLKHDLNKEDRRIILALAAEYFADVNETELDQAMHSLKGLKEKFKEFWNEWLPGIRLGSKVVSSLLKRGLDFGDFDRLSEFKNTEFSVAQSLKYQLKLIVNLARKLHWTSVYYLIDRVDESALTGNSVTDSFSLLKPLLRDLELLEFEGVGFKFFLWDLLQPLCDEIVRTDRIPQETLNWDTALLHQLWNRRLSAYSDTNILRLADIAEPTKPHDIDELAFIFASHSPRDLIRIGYKILAEQVEYDSTSPKLQSTAIYTAINKFCAQRATELFSKQRILRELRKVHQVDFTIPYLANEIFKEKQSSTRNRLMVWREQAAIIDVERIEVSNTDNVRNVKLFAIKDIRVAREIFSEIDVPSFLTKKFRKCPNCDAILLRDWGDVDSSGICHDCQTDLLAERGDDLEIWRRKELAAQNRKKYRSETLEPQAIQLGLFDE
jgi:hypothetical protein